MQKAVALTVTVDSTQQHVCANSDCQRPGAGMQCVRCRQVWYCNKACQRSHWKSEHKKQCYKLAETTNTLISATKMEVEVYNPDTTSSTRAIVIETNDPSKCGNCNNSRPQQPCAKCKMVFYCNSTCRRAHWLEHKKDCARDALIQRVSSNGVISAGDLVELYGMDGADAYFQKCMDQASEADLKQSHVVNVMFTTYAEFLWYYKKDYAKAAEQFEKVLAAKPDCSMIQYNLGYLRFRHLNDMPGAERAFLQALRIEKNNWMFHFDLARLREKKGNMTLAEKGYLQALRCCSTAVKPRLALGLLLLEHKKEYEAAAHHFREALKYESDSVAALFNLASALQLMGQNQEALEFYNKALELQPTAELHYIIGQLLTENFEFARAETHLRKSLEMRPDDARCMCELAGLLTHHRGGQPDVEEAEGWLNRALELHPTTAAAHTQMGELLRERKQDHVAAERHFREALRLDARDPEAHFALGKLLADKYHDYDQAESHFREVVKASPRHAEGHLRLGKLLAQVRQDSKGAKRHLKEASRAANGSPPHRRAYANYLLGELMLKDGDADGAKINFLAALKLDSDLLGAHLGLAKVYMPGDAAAAEKCYREAIRVDPEDLSTRLSLAALLYEERGNFPEAREICRSVLDRDPTHQDARVHLALMAQREFDFVAVRRHSADAIRYAKDRSPWGLGQVSAALGRQRTKQFVTRARAALKKAAAEAPRNPTSHINFAVFLVDLKGDYKVAEKHYKTVLQLEPNCQVAHSDMALIMQKKKEMDKAEHHLREAVRCAPNLAEVYDALAVFLVQVQQNYTEAEEWFTKALEQDPYDAFAHAELGALLYEHRKQYTKAEQHYRAALRAGGPTDQTVHVNLAVLLAEQKKEYRKAEGHYKKALELNPECTLAHTHLGRLLHLYLKSPVSAREHLQEAVRLSPGDPLARYHLAFFLQAQEEFKEAREQLNEALRLDPNFSLAHGLLAAMVQLKESEESSEVQYLQARQTTHPKGVAAVHCQLAQLLLQRNDQEGAHKHFMEATRLDPHSEEAKNGLAETRATLPPEEQKSDSVCSVSKADGIKIPEAQQNSADKSGVSQPPTHPPKPTHETKQAECSPNELGSDIGDELRELSMAATKRKGVGFDPQNLKPAMPIPFVDKGCSFQDLEDSLPSLSPLENERLRGGFPLKWQRSSPHQDSTDKSNKSAESDQVLKSSGHGTPTDGKSIPVCVDPCAKTNPPKESGTKVLPMGENDIEAEIWQVSSEKKECIVCMNLERDSVIVPCGHVCCCIECAAMLKEEESSCPVCRGCISDVVKMFHV